jgi:hypothetical protein
MSRPINCKFVHTYHDGLNLYIVFITLFEMVGRKEYNVRQNHQYFYPVGTFRHGSVGLLNQGTINAKPKS